jgi:two-component system copper resistance phosphate regulon response regulator CusR
MKLLVVEDEKRMLELLRKGLEEEGHTVVCATDGIEGLKLCASHEYDVIILDVMMPKLDGFSMVERLRAQKIPTPVLMLTAKDGVPYVVHGLDLGADDYMTKPFSFQELVARLRAIKRRKFIPQAAILKVADLLLDTATREVSRGGAFIPLTRTEFGLLETLMERAGRVVSRRALTESVWGLDRDIEENTLDVFVRLLRNKVDGDRPEKLIRTVRGIGYIIRAEKP